MNFTKFLRTPVFVESLRWLPQSITDQIIGWAESLFIMKTAVFTRLQNQVRPSKIKITKRKRNRNYYLQS